MSPRLTANEVRDRAREARAILSCCRLCPRRCGVDRTNGQTGYCRSGPEPALATIMPHFGEEPPLIGEGGAGTIFFSRCNLRCVYCQNHQISQGDVGRVSTAAELAAAMLHLRERGCANVEAVSPSHHLAGFLEALASATEGGLDLPVVYNTNGYECPETLDLLDGVVDIYLPDLKYAAPAHATRYSDGEDYVEVARAAITAMHRQVGNLVVDFQGRAVRGMILRHLILPGGISGSAQTLAWIKSALPVTVTLSLMAQYAPLHRGPLFPPLNRSITREEYDNVIDLAWEKGFENVFIQDLAATETGIPDFEKGRPFTWD